MAISNHGMNVLSQGLRTTPRFPSGWQISIPHVILEKWENEGGSIRHPTTSLQSSASPPSQHEKAKDLAERICSMSDQLFHDFADGRVGQRFNTYEHRSRVIRRMTAELRMLERHLK